MSYTNRMVVDVRGIATTGLTASTTLANHLSGIQTALLAQLNHASNSDVERAFEHLNILADVLRTLHM